MNLNEHVAVKLQGIEAYQRIAAKSLVSQSDGHSVRVGSPLVAGAYSMLHSGSFRQQNWGSLSQRQLAVV